MRLLSCLFCFMVIQNVLSLSLPPFATLESLETTHDNLTRLVTFLHFHTLNTRTKLRRMGADSQMCN